MSRAYIALINTVIVILGMVLSGVTIDFIITRLTLVIYKYLGNFMTLLIMNYLTFVGVIHHELSHALFAFITGADVIKVDLFKVTNNTLGQVVYRPRGNMFLRSIQNTLSAIAPMVTGIFSEYTLYNILTKYKLNGSIKVLIYYLMISILCHMRLSNQDIKMMLRGLLIFSLIIFIIMYITQFNLFTYLHIKSV